MKRLGYEVSLSGGLNVAPKCAETLVPYLRLVYAMHSQFLWQEVVRFITCDVMNRTLIDWNVCSGQALTFQSTCSSKITPALRT